ncbi:synapse differentiation-inducing gene protein 1-like [Bufo gargarizans]|uniref:synapse differentiation-inducing gene protein 1-like n=1 Tax=Bufo gargarizans TaxID=30331 RepID=UPI001CF4FD08|nr:synapse differentiation-inducing gene protein 1-like [Bufo gargarizans]
MENTAFQEPYPSKPMDQPPAYSPGPPVMQPPPYPAYYPPGPDHGVQQTLISQPTLTRVVVVNGQTTSTDGHYEDYLCWSISNFLFCFWPLGFAAIIFSCKTASDIEAYNFDAAAKHSRIAFKLNTLSLIIGIIGIIFISYYMIVRSHK